MYTTSRIAFFIVATLLLTVACNNTEKPTEEKPVFKIAEPQREALQKAKDLEKNVRTMMTQGFQKLDLVTRDEFDLQAKVLAKTREKLTALEAKVAEIEKLRS